MLYLLNQQYNKTDRDLHRQKSVASQLHTLCIQLDQALSVSNHIINHIMPLAINALWGKHTHANV